jgi:hypothetical protein
VIRVSTLGRAAIAGAAGAALLAGCSSSPTPVTSTTSAPASPTAATTSSAAPSAAATVASDASPFSGRPGGAGKPVLVVKIDNTRFAQPQAGLHAADLVYIEQVEYGLTRLAAVFSSTLPRTVGPIRSARISDIDLLAQFGKPAFAYSGAQHLMRPLLGKASIYNVSGDVGPSGYFRDNGRRPPYNFMGHPSALLARAPHASAARDIGFVFSTTPPAGGRPATKAVVTWPASQAAFVWNPATSSYTVWLNKKPAQATEGGGEHATTVVLQYVAQHDSEFHDKFGGHTPFITTTGKGTGYVLRNGRAYPVTWSRPSLTGGTTFTGADGQVVAFAPGQVWVALVPSTRRVSLG